MTMSSDGPHTEPEALRKKVSGVLVGSRPTSLTCDAKLVAWASTRHGVVIGDSSVRLLTGTVSVHLAAASMAERPASNSVVVAASVLTRAAPEAVCTHHPSAVRRIEMVITGSFFLSVG